MVAAKSEPKLLVIVGETASGKSVLALKIAKQFNGEIIAADSWTVYKGFDVGTGKPTITQQKAVKHHLLDVTEATAGFNAPIFKELAESAIKDIQNRGKLPILVGGTGLYIDSLLFDYSFIADVSSTLRAELNVMSIPQLIAKAAAEQIDLSGIDLGNKRRIIRAIEAEGEVPTKQNLRAGTVIIGLQQSRDQLRNSVEQRVDNMLKAGLEFEVKGLSEKYSWDIEPLKGIGYREWQGYFAGDKNLQQTKQHIISATMKLAKRQRTWFKRNKNIQWFSSADEAYRYISGLLSN